MPSRGGSLRSLSTPMRGLDFPELFATEQCADFTIFAGHSISFGGPRTSILTGSVATSPGISIGGNYQLVSGVALKGTPEAAECANDFDHVMSDASNATCTAANTLKNPKLRGLRLLPGAYCANSTMFPACTVILDGCNKSSPQWLFQSAAILVISNLTSFDLINGATSNNVYWKIGSSLAIGYNSKLIGIILAQDSIHFGSGALLVGRAMAKKSVYFDGGSSLAMSVSLSTYSPSAAPTPPLTDIPTAGPSTYPTFAVRSPTPAPTIAKFLRIEVLQVVNGIAIQDAGSEAFQDAFQESVAQTISLPLQDINITVIEAHFTSRGDTLVANASAINVMYTVEVPNGNSTAIISILSSSNFTVDVTASLQRQGYGYTTATNAVFRNTSPTYSPTNAQQKIDYSNVTITRIVIGSTIGVFGICFISLYFIYASKGCKSVRPALAVNDVCYSDNVLSNYEINKLTCQ